MMSRSDQLILGIETSCDDTAAAIVSGGRLISSIVSSQPLHDRYGGVVPELASRDHQKNIVTVARTALREASVTLSDVDAIAVTYGPGLAGSLLVGLSFAKGLSASLGVPLVGVNHIEGHIYSVFIDEPSPPFPFLCLIVSGGHTMLVHVREEGQHEVLGTTRDDAAGEAFDKVAKMLGLPYPGGPQIDRLASQGNPEFHLFPRARLDGYDYSFSGVKTSMLYFLNGIPKVDRRRYLEDNMSDLCASFQSAVVEMIMDPLSRAARDTRIQAIALTGGVSANSGLRDAAATFCQDNGLDLYVPEPSYCMDNAAMIATAAHHMLAVVITSPLTLTADPAATLA